MAKVTITMEQPLLDALQAEADHRELMLTQLGRQLLREALARRGRHVARPRRERRYKRQLVHH